MLGSETRCERALGARSLAETNPRGISIRSSRSRNERFISVFAAAGVRTA